MSATAEIRALCDQPGRELREALIRYSKGNARTSYSIQADSMLYGDLVRHYLQWCAGLLAKMQEATAARPAWKDAVAQLLERTAAYFKRPRAGLRCLTWSTPCGSSCLPATPPAQRNG